MNIKFDKLLKKIREADTSTYGRTTSRVVAAANSLDTTNADYICDGVSDQAQINQALSDIASSGGKVLLMEGTYNLTADITIPASLITLEGSNPEATIIDCNGAFQIIASGTDGVEITGLTVKDSTDVNGSIYLATANRARIHNCRFTGNGSGNGNTGSIKLSASTDVMIFDNQFNEANTNGIGISVQNSSHRFIISNNVFRGGQSGLTFIEVGENSARSQYGQIVNNKCYLDVASQRFIKTADTSGFELLIANNLCYGTFTFCYDTNSSTVYLIGNILISTGSPASSEGIVARTDCIVVGNVVKGTVPVYPIYIIGHGNMVSGNIGQVTYAAEDTKSVAINNYGSTVMDERLVVKMKNSSGGALAKGDVVVHKDTAAGDEVTTTTTAGNPKVFGMALDTIADAAYGYFLVTGKTVSLKVDGTTDIAIGDLLSTFTTAKIAKKAATGEVAFARALEAYTADDSNGVIDALLITPRVAL